MPPQQSRKRRGSTDSQLREAGDAPAPKISSAERLRVAGNKLANRGAEDISQAGKDWTDKQARRRVDPVATYGPRTKPGLVLSKSTPANIQEAGQESPADTSKPAPAPNASAGKARRQQSDAALFAEAFKQYKSGSVKSTKEKAMKAISNSPSQFKQSAPIQIVSNPVVSRAVAKKSDKYNDSWFDSLPDYSEKSTSKKSRSSLRFNY